MFKIKTVTIESIILAAHNTYPNEFMAMLGSTENNDVIDELVIVPAVYGEEHVIIQTYMMPIDNRLRGSIHSHPSYNNQPSQDDIRTFGKLGKIHLIIAYPFNINTIRAYNASGKETKIKVIE